MHGVLTFFIDLTYRPEHFLEGKNIQYLKILETWLKTGQLSSLNLPSMSEWCHLPCLKNKEFPECISLIGRRIYSTLHLLLYLQSFCIFWSLILMIVLVVMIIFSVIFNYINMPFYQLFLLASFQYIIFWSINAMKEKNAVSTHLQILFLIAFRILNFPQHSFELSGRWPSHQLSVGEKRERERKCIFSHCL